MAREAGCALDGAPVESDGSRRLALLVGVGEYADDEILDLSGPPSDVGAMVELLTQQYRFPPENLCVLLDQDATVAGVRSAFRRALIDRARPDAGDVAVFFYAGHGSQTPDRNGDEADHEDEVFVLHDSRAGQEDDLLDDEFNDWLLELHGRTPHVTVIFDSCNSGSASRGERDDTVARFVPPATRSEVALEPGGGGDGGGWTPAELPGLVVLSAARDGTKALESGRIGHGYFTHNLVQVLRSPSAGPLTWSQVALKLERRIPNATSQRQWPVFQGQLESFVFEDREHHAPAAWKVAETDPLRLRGVVLPGWGPGAEVRVHAGSASAAEVQEPARAKAVLSIRAFDGIEASADLVGSAREPIEVGDVAVLARPSPESTRLPVRLDGVPGAVADRLRAELEEDPERSALIELSDRTDAFRLAVDRAGRLVLRGPEGELRNTYQGEPEAAVGAAVENLGQFARQRALLWLEGESGGDFRNDETLRVRIVRGPSDHRLSCDGPGWVQACPNEEQIIPVCTLWQIEVENTHPSIGLWIGGAVLSNDGGMVGFPTANTAMRLEPGQSARVPGLAFKASPPLNALEHVVVFGTRKQIDWTVLTSAAVRGTGGGSLQAMLQRYVAGTRGSPVVSLDDDYGTWTSSHVPLRVVANAHFVERDARARRCHDQADREYTVNDFDIAPYLPEDEDDALHRVLQQAHALARRAHDDGVPYKQHAWAADGDDANLAVGIDCSRSIWFAFTRAGLPYTPDDAYVWTGGMVGEDSPLAEHFDDCMGEPRRTGDVLVYRGPNRDGTAILGHTVMVIDPFQRVAWGSHGWDGNPGAGLAMEMDTGVEYQRILRKPDWGAWDSTRYALQACWRHRQFADR